MKNENGGHEPRIIVKWTGKNRKQKKAIITSSLHHDSFAYWPTPRFRPLAVVGEVPFSLIHSRFTFNLIPPLSVTTVTPSDAKGARLVTASDDSRPRAPGTNPINCLPRTPAAAESLRHAHGGGARGIIQHAPATWLRNRERAAHGR